MNSQQSSAREIVLDAIHPDATREGYTWVSSEDIPANDLNERIIVREVVGAATGHRTAEDALDDAIHFAKEAMEKMGFTMNPTLLSKIKELKGVLK